MGKKFKYTKPEFEQVFKFKSKAHGEIELKVTDKGFCLWTKEKGHHNRITNHWIIDASCITDDDEMRLGNEVHWKKVVRYEYHTIEGGRLKLVKKKTGGPTDGKEK